MNEESGYDPDELDRLWIMDYEELAKAPGRPNGRLREARFVMQAKVANETRRLIWMTFLMALATFAMAVATIIMAVATLAD
jgi:hypothetical protein